jgi:hypothetical protein
VKFPLQQFEEFCSKLTVDSKEEGQISLAPAQLMGTQRYHIEQVVRGLEADVHDFTVLKARQLGITTIQLALDLFWHYRFKGMQGTLAADSEENRDMFRSTLTQFHEGMDPYYRIQMVVNNRNFMAWKNRSRMFLQIGGGVKKKKGGKGRGKGLAFIHGTELSSWEDEDSLVSIIASLAQSNPRRLYVWESTARGFNLFHDMYKVAQEATSKRAIFIAWWRNERYRCERGSNEYRVYWDGVLTPQEADWVRAVKLLYKYELEPEQMAWWRWMMREQVQDEDMMFQEYAPTEEMAFILSGKNFFSPVQVQQTKDRINFDAAEGKVPSCWRFHFGADFVHTELKQVGEVMAHLRVWEEPVEGAFYSIGADPAYGSSSWADRSAAEVWRCYGDRFEQVAEFCAPEIDTYKFAWVLIYLAGAYRNSMLNLELNGPGEAVLGEIDNVRRQAGLLANAGGGPVLQNVIKHMRYFIYRRLDTPFGGQVYHWKTTQDTKDRAFNTFRDLYSRGEAIVNSPVLCAEMKIIVREDDGFLGASGRGKDDCSVASAIAAENHVRYIKMKLKQAEITWDKESARRKQLKDVGRAQNPVEEAANRSVANYLGGLGIKYGPKQPELK